MFKDDPSKNEYVNSSQQLAISPMMLSRICLMTSRSETWMISRRVPGELCQLISAGEATSWRGRQSYLLHMNYLHDQIQPFLIRAHARAATRAPPKWVEADVWPCPRKFEHESVSLRPGRHDKQFIVSTKKNWKKISRTIRRKKKETEDFW
jgi:hypothetical protein